MAALLYLRLGRYADGVRIRPLLVGIAAFAAWSLFMGYLLSIGVWADTGELGDDPASGSVERGLYVLIWLFGVVLIAPMSISVSRKRPSPPSN